MRPETLDMIWPDASVLIAARDLNSLYIKIESLQCEIEAKDRLLLETYQVLADCHARFNDFTDVPPPESLIKWDELRPPTASELIAAIRKNPWMDGATFE